MANVKYLIVAGGGGGGGSSGDAVTGGGGAGAGGLLYNALYPLFEGSYPIVVGSGGAGGAQGSVGAKGTDSSFDTLVTYGGGAGRDADDNNTTISNGGSGGGASGSAGGAAGTGISGQGYSGGTKNDPAGGSFVGGGGGGAGGAGSGRTRGIGISNDITGSAVTYAEGGYGQGTSNNINAGVAGTPNTGNGGNGANKGSSQSGGAGGSGIVIVSYATGVFGNDSSGGTKTVVGSETIHTFTSSDTLILTSANPYYSAYCAIIGLLPLNNNGVYTVNSYAAYEIAIALCDLTLTAEDTNEVLTQETIAIQAAYDLLVAMPTLQVLVIAGGGGGGGGWEGGGGGAGGLLSNNNYSIAPGSYPVTIGNGGAGAKSANSYHGQNGGNSIFNDLTAIGGGHGGAEGGSPIPPENGGSGGGGFCWQLTPGSGTAGQGYAGGSAVASAPYMGGGGGGAGSVGQNGTTSYGGAGGAGVNNDISGSTIGYAGGGGGSMRSGTQGTATHGGGAANLGSTAGVSGTPNTGGGGGAGANSGVGIGGDGGSGIVIIRYVTSAFGECTGGTKTTNGIYTIHTFTTDGTLVMVNGADYLPEGTATLGAFVLPTMIADPESSEINWTEEVPLDTTLVIKVAIVDTVPEETDFQIATNGGAIPGLEALSSGKNLYIKAYLSTIDVIKTPKLLTLGYTIVEQESEYQVQINLSYAGRLKHPQGNINVLYTNGLIGVGNSPVSSFSEDFIPVVNPLWFKPNDPEYITAGINTATINVFDVTFKIGQNGDEYLTAGLYAATITITNVGGLPL